NALGYGIILIAVSFFRELFGSGSILGFVVIPESFYSAGYENVGLMVLSPGAFIILGLIIWVQRLITKVEEEA
ncbi:MAG: NADH:ubiquinone reductase (Na(+)-transporting) subunit D, partial [Candidatus Marinimicrobia bacterium]|nr:NADH:ubiquinone reductase (Na(+)-transporting) subunit D [Candidatus Neomarinimicrobiota bacterium]